MYDKKAKGDTHNGRFLILFVVLWCSQFSSLLSRTKWKPSFLLPCPSSIQLCILSFLSFFILQQWKKKKNTQISNLKDCGPFYELIPGLGHERTFINYHLTGFVSLGLWEFSNIISFISLFKTEVSAVYVSVYFFAINLIFFT